MLTSSNYMFSPAGVFGTTEILFRSQMQGLKLSDALGSGFSCNGNTGDTTLEFFWIRPKATLKDTFSRTARAGYLFILYIFIEFHHPGLGTSLVKLKLTILLTGVFLHVSLS